MNTRSLKITNYTPIAPSSNSVSKSDWVRLIEDAQHSCEENELKLTSASNDFAERHSAGAYYTPVDVCDFFWNEFFALKKIDTRKQATSFIATSLIVEPAAGAGIFLFSLLKKLIQLGCEPSDLEAISVWCCDINFQALSFIKRTKAALEKQIGPLGNWHFSRADYLSVKTISFAGRKPVFIGNPPFVRNKQGARWKNSFADFFEKSYTMYSKLDLAFIMPLSFAFSRDYTRLRDLTFSTPASVSLVNFDNIPDCLFKAGKKNGPTTNTANSQRCSITYVFKGGEPNIQSTPLIRWKTSARKNIFARRPDYYDCKKFDYESQIPRPASKRIQTYLCQKKNSQTLSGLIDKNGKYDLAVAAVARNFICFREKDGTGVYRLMFKTQKARAQALAILASDVFFEYWLSLGDGFHLTKSDIQNFPISEDLLKWSANQTVQVQKTWSDRKAFLKSKLNAGKTSQSYDFTNLFKFWEKA